MLKTLPIFSDERGSLVIANAETSTCPLEIKRVFWVRLRPNATRGGHFHKRCNQAMILLDGAIRLDVGDESFLLKRQNELVYLPMFHCIKYTNLSTCDDAIVLVFADEYYDPNDVHNCEQLK